MKKCFMLCFLFVLFIYANAFSLTIGHNLIGRNNLDNWTSFTMIDKSLQFDTPGYIKSWSIYRADYTNEEYSFPSDIYFQIFSHVSNDEYKLISQDEFTVEASSGPTLTFNTDDKNTIFSKNDYIGWTFTQPVFGYDGDESITVDWPSASNTSITNVGETFNFAGSGGERVYSISAEYQPVPEPTTWLFFGTGLIGLVAFGRKKFLRKSRPSRL